MRKYNTVYGAWSWFEEAKPSEECNVVSYYDDKPKCTNSTVVTIIGEWRVRNEVIEMRRRSFCKDCGTTLLTKALRKMEDPDFLPKDAESLTIMHERQDFIRLVLDFINGEKNGQERK